MRPAAAHSLRSHVCGPRREISKAHVLGNFGLKLIPPPAGVGTPCRRALQPLLYCLGESLLLDRMEKLIREYGMLPPGTKALCAVSGGADSVCLLHRLYHLRARLGIQVAAAHYNHQLRGEESDRDEEFVREFVRFCCGRDRWLDEHGQHQELPPVGLIVGRGDVAVQAKRRGRGLEETAREMRYTFLRQTAQEIGAEVIATAHNGNDNAETLLLHLARGTGLRGLTGIAPVRGDLIRPLLTTSRQEVEDYLRYYGLPYMDDSTNRDDAYTRNRIRHKIVPEFDDIYPGFLERIAQTTAALRLDEEYLEQQARQVVQQARRERDGMVIPAQAIAQAHPALAVRAARILIGAMTQGNDNCTAAHLKALVDLCKEEAPSARADLPNGLTARREYDKLLLTRYKPQPLTEAILLEMPGVTCAGEYRLECREILYQGQASQPNDFCLSQSLTKEVTVRARRTGDHLRRPGRRTKTLKKLLIDEKVPLSRRDGLPVLESGGRVAAVGSLGPDQAFCPQKGERAWHITITSLDRPGI